MERPNPTAGMRHIALYVRDLEVAEQFYVGLLGMRVEWRPDPDNVYLTSGNDNLALHRRDAAPAEKGQLLDHIGFIMKTPGDVDDWHHFLQANGVEMKSEPRTHRDGARSFYCVGPEKVIVQMIYHPPIADR
ncbi:catechol 2,3-dioxygenase-like lactoylglutathione lyase family enzyme [Thiogranum longum]|uniref:Catechol 2,3-dioxygenase-like lactoylglutathione lyase family enzyme n=1 Tax=Thiogranum longum TaxID=1537524 RepID=A0A4R1H646_9GAMM|nr:VOC family protein [Thiogranum longum]TCK17207.1 catechol 2,3-dioxygenase-like lactoylglutathione lyase family enzyme [Thiogranum longum]